MKQLSYNGPAHVRQFSEEDIASLKVTSPKALLFKRREPQEVSNELGEALLKLGGFTDVTTDEGNPEAEAAKAAKKQAKADEEAAAALAEQKVEVTGDPTASGDASGSHAATELASPKAGKTSR